MNKSQWKAGGDKHREQEHVTNERRDKADKRCRKPCEKTVAMLDDYKEIGIDIPGVADSERKMDG